MKTAVLKILILGGTNFLGPHLVEELEHRGHEITLFNRGTQDMSHFPQVEKLQGDRDGDLTALEGRTWDAVIDTSGHLPRIVEQSSKLLAGATDHYTFISTVGVYANFHTLGIDEEYPLAVLENPETEEITLETYGGLKAMCEHVVNNYFPGKALIIRPGLIVGPGDKTDRFTYWPVRMKEGGDVLAPNSPSDNVQFIDVRDLAKWIVDMVEINSTGVFNATGEPLSFENLLAECQNVTQVDTMLYWVSEDFLLKHQVQDWVELPLWLSSKRNMPGFLNIRTAKARSQGLTIRPLSETIRATLEWDAGRTDVVRQGWLSYEREQELLHLWKQKK
jgi:2'-hydroxyisoflavone reductase